MTARCPTCGTEVERYRIGRGRRGRGPGVEALYCPACDAVALLPVGEAPPPRRHLALVPAHRKDLDG
jgi:hypothetical protein